MKVTMLAAFLLAVAITPAQSAEPTFASLQTMCMNTKDPQQQGCCAGFVEAVASRIAREDKSCALLGSYIAQANSDLALTDVIADIDGAVSGQRVRGGGEIPV
ncbi:hypothetical protein [Pararhizobium qamdonense]|uniref:hypothetical protein n=1 Tax=Pararhizobium qamdonense TaxID=3031126 RepID=UPI0023E0B88C|nr:hypothetical protein [Pararhizobium qamdonense]